MCTPITPLHSETSIEGKNIKKFKNYIDLNFTLETNSIFSYPFIFIKWRTWPRKIKVLDEFTV